jgi:uncharacterized membrane protein YeaQ/YmgE (transglycosylase-associated protein family)
MFTHYLINIKQNKNNYMQVILTIIGGFIGAIIPNKLSNIPHLLMSIIIGSLLSKTIYGDFDIGYQWSFSDIYYWIITIIESLVGGFLALYLKKINKSFHY